MTDQELKDLVASFAVDRKKSREEFDQRMRENERLFKESREAAERRSQETDRQLDKLKEDLKELSIQIGGIDNNIGYHAEQYFQDILAEKLTFGGQKYDRMIPNLECFGKNKVSLIEFDIVMVNGKSVAIIETKNRIHPNFVKKLVEERLPKFRELLPEFSKCKAYLGIAGFSFSKRVLEEARKYGIGVVRQIGDSVEIDTNHLKAY